VNFFGLFAAREKSQNINITAKIPLKNALSPSQNLLTQAPAQIIIKVYVSATIDWSRPSLKK
jgi:hypothetical protein